MKKYLIIEDEKIITKYEYDIDEIIRYNNKPIKCIKKETINDELLQYFKFGRTTFDY